MDAFYGEIRAFPFTFAPENWAYCNGATMSTSQFQALFAILGIAYGGDGKTTFQLPNLNGMIVVGAGAGPGVSAWTVAQTRGEESVTIIATTYPAHTHQAAGGMGMPTLRTASANTQAPLSLLSQVNDGTAGVNAFDTNPIAPTDKVVMPATALSPTVSKNQPHENRQPVLPLSWCICTSNAAWPEHP